MGEGAFVNTLAEYGKTWTWKDLQDLPEELDWRRFEIVDGALVVSPAAGRRHEYVRALAQPAILAGLPDDLFVLGPVGADLGASYRIPDLLVARRQVLATFDPAPLPPAQIVLAVEIVSPSSVTTDRITKPAQYAAAGIGAYWRVELRPEVSLSAYVLRPGETTYTELGTWGEGQVADIAEPFPIRIPIDDLVPRA